jgi:putative MFS transporter
VGLIVSIAWAPETKNLSLHEASDPLLETENSPKGTEMPFTKNEKIT